jgi:hypothetical protein
MSKRNLLHESRLDEFKEWLCRDGWVIGRPIGNSGEVFRAKKKSKNTLIVYNSEEINSEYYTLGDEWITLAALFHKHTRRVELSDDGRDCWHMTNEERCQHLWWLLKQADEILSSFDKDIKAKIYNDSTYSLPNCVNHALGAVAMIKGGSDEFDFERQL